MFRHKKRIGLITLVVFTLLTVLSGAAMAAKTPAEKPAVVKPATGAAGGGTGGGADPGERVENNVDNWSRNVYLTGLSVSQDGATLYEAEREYRGKPYKGWYVKEKTNDVHNVAGAKPGAVTVYASRKVSQSDYVGFSSDGVNWTTYFMDSQETPHSFETILSEGDNTVYVRVGELKDDDIHEFSYKYWFFGWHYVNNIRKERIYTINIPASDDRMISLDPNSMTLRARRDPGIVEAIIGPAEEEQYEATGSLPYGECTAVVEWSTESDLINLVPYEEEGRYFCKIEPLKRGTAIVRAALSNGAEAFLSVTIRGVKKQEEPEPAPAPAALPEIPAPPALETYDVTITVGSNQAIVDGEQVELNGNTLLFGEDRAMVDYADMAKLIPGLEVTWDWQTLSVTFSKDDQELTMVLDEIPAGFDVPFINIGGRLVVPVRYVGSFFGATVDWIGDTLVVHMYK